jgi:hypothetical protein
MDALIEMPGKGVARRSVAKGAGLTLINDTLSDFAERLRIADECRRQLQQGDTYLGGEHEPEAKFLDRAKIIHGHLLRNIAEVDATNAALLDVLIPPWRSPLTHAQATAMLGVLFGTLSKKRADDENSAMLLAACADLFNPINDTIGAETGLWEPVSKHPLVLAIAIKKLIATSVFTPSPSELREAMKLATRKLDSLASYTCEWLDLLQKADAILFEFDRDSWNVAYANVGSKIALAISDRAIENDDRMTVLNKLWEAKQEHEEVAERVRIAACKTAPAKRSRKPKGG